MRLIGYIRVSTEDQAKEGQSLSIQDMQLHRYCDLYDHELVDVIVDDGVSASMPLEKRHGGSQLIDRLRDREADGFVVQRLDRAFRITTDGLATAENFKAQRLGIHSVNEHIDTASPMGYYFLTLLLANAQLERDRISERATEVSNGLREQGKAYGPTPYGCTRRGDKLYRDAKTWGIRNRIIEMKDTLSLRAICAQLEAEHIAAPSGGRYWHPSTLKGIIGTHHGIEHIPMMPLDNDAPVSEEKGAQMEVVK